MASQFKPKAKRKLCYCEAYLNARTGKPFPHTMDSKACRELYNEEGGFDQKSDDVLELYLFDRTEAQAINSAR